MQVIVLFWKAWLVLVAAGESARMAEKRSLAEIFIVKSSCFRTGTKKDKN